jgi:hypothetical protein
MQFKAAARTKLVAPLLSSASNARTTASGFDMMDESVSVSRTCVRLSAARTRHSNSPSDAMASPSAIHSSGSNASTSTDWKIASKKYGIRSFP